jgi:hypothetical protein
MMRKLVLGLLLVFLSGCVPALLNLILQDPDKGELRFATNADGATIRFSAGEKDAEDVALYIGGENLQMADPNCGPVDNGIGCELGTIAAGDSYEVMVQGARLTSSVTYYRPGSSQPVLLLTEVK